MKKRTKTTTSEIIREIVLDWLDTEPDYLAFIEAFPEDEFEEYQDDDDKLRELYEAALKEFRMLRVIYGGLPKEIVTAYGEKENN